MWIVAIVYSYATIRIAAYENHQDAYLLGLEYSALGANVKTYFDTQYS